MKYVSLDIETTGLDPARDQVLSLAMVLEDTENPAPIEKLPTFYCLVAHERYEGDAFALQMNAWILKELAKGNAHFNKKISDSPATGPVFRQWPVYGAADLRKAAPRWLFDQGITPDTKCVAAGQNVGAFDMAFLLWLKPYFQYRYIEPASVFLDFARHDKPPGLLDLATKYNVVQPTHDALDDARSVIAVLRTLYAPKVPL